MNDRPFDGGPSWRVVRTLTDGTPVTIRPITPEDREDLRAGIAALSPASRYFRFLQLQGPPSDELLDYLVHVDQKTHVAIGAEIVSPDLKTTRGVGVARFIRLEDNIAEAAVTVADDMHRRGVATVLLAELLRAAEVRGIERFRAEIAADNASMRTILDRAGAKQVEDLGSAITYELALNPSHTATFYEVLKDAAESKAAWITRHALPMVAQASRLLR